MDTCTLAEARDLLGPLVNSVRLGGGPIAITENGKPVVVLISVEELEVLQRARDEADLALARSIAEDPEARWVPHAEAEAVLEADAAADALPRERPRAPAE
ncbi:type II toxin-antitoxin system Phd/YefM family antitoxin [Streptomyces roseoverticillatus]|uniref:type II toxin-antitoxin system Phd/YefM family antitoxin n=1 Tax=Streptomyces roseoverticillatus TaxID=66429 RepID=UPI001F482FE9|nr:type II toxin-antitoxin system Phd/YefM family antitoxin [Streptomyces roseoverticillatus]MCF3103773.1 type II toxin-antitoxin system Phd/YefM family antitoxin [Streptomyces roseoverticillatus]